MPTAHPITRAALKLARFLLDNGCDGLNVLGTTGEATSFSRDERMGLMSAYRDNGLPMERLMVGTGAAAVSDAVALTRHAAEPRLCRRAGAAALLLQGRVPDDGLAAYIDTIVEGDGRQADPDLSLSLPGAVRLALAYRADPPVDRNARQRASPG